MVQACVERRKGAVEGIWEIGDKEVDIINHKSRKLPSGTYNFLEVPGS